MKHLINFISFLFLTLLLFNLMACTKTENAFNSPTALLSFGNGSGIENPILVATKNNGLILGHTIWNDDNTDARVVSIDEKGRVLWERSIGSKYDDNLQKLYVDNLGNILMVGMSKGFKDTSFKTVFDSEKFYLHYLSPDGKTIWEKGLDVNERFNRLGDYKIIDIQENEFGDFLITAHYGNEFMVNNNWELKLYGTLLVLSSEGELLNLYVQGVEPFYAPFSSNRGFGVFYTKSTGAGVLNFSRADTMFTPDKGMESPTETNWSWKSNEDPILGVWRSSIGPVKMQFVVVKKEEFVLFEFIENGSLIGKDIKLSEKLGASYPVAMTAGNQKFAFADVNGEIFILNQSLELVNKIKTPWDILSLSLLSNGNVAVVFQKENVIQTMLYDLNGKAIL